MGKTYLQCKSVLPLHIANRLPSSGEKQINETTTKKSILPNATESINFGRSALNSIEPKNAKNSMSITIEYEMNEEEEGEENLDDYYVNDNANNDEYDKNDENNENDEDDDEDDDDTEDDYSSDENGKRASSNKKLKNQPSSDDCGDCDDDDEDANENEDEDDNE